MSEIVHLKSTDPSVRRILAAAFPGENPPEVKAIVSETVQFTGTTWDSGYKRDYRIVDLSTMELRPVPAAPSPWQEGDFHRSAHAIPPGCVVVVYQYAGMRRWFEIIGHPQTVSPMIPAPVELSPCERIVLCATRSLKSSYGGISNYRFHQAQQYTGIVSSQWDEAKSALIARGMLNKAGAITPDGRNAIGHVDLYQLRETLRTPARLEVTA